MKKIFSEIGFGNETFLSTEIEDGDNEQRIPKFIIPEKIKGIYLRFWIGKKVLIISTKDGVRLKHKDKKKLKLLFGLEGEG